MKRFRFETHGLPLVVVFVVLCAAAICAAQEELIWPVKTDLIYNDGDIAESGTEVGCRSCSIWNTKNDLKIDINPGEGLEDQGGRHPCRRRSGRF